MNLTQKLILVTSLLLFLAAPSFAQNNVLKVSPFKLSYKNLALSFEHVFSGELTGSLGTSIFLSTDFRNGVANNLSGVDNTDNLTLGSVVLSGYTFTPAIRYYPGGKAPKGFFLDPFVRFLQYRAAVDAAFNSATEVSNVESNIRFRAIGPGLALGYQWVIGERFTIEWHGGLGLAVGTVRHQGTILDGPVADNIDAYLDEINAYINDNVPFIDKELTSDDLTSLQFRLPGIVWPVFRSGLVLGFAF